MREALAAAVDDLNGRGGVLGQHVTLAIEDDGCAQETAAASARRIVAARPAAVIGHPCSSSAIAAAPIYAGAGLILISPGARHPALTEKRAGPTIFRLAGRDDRQGAAAAAWLAAETGRGPIAVVHDRTAYARAIAEATAAVLKGAGQKSVPILTIVAGGKEYQALGAEIAALGARALFFAGYPAEAALVVAAGRRAIPDLRVLGSDSLATEDFAAALGPGIDGVQVLVADAPRGLAAEISSGPRDATAGQGLIARTRAALEVWASAATQAGTLEPQRVAEVLAHSKAETQALGPVAFSGTGDALIPSYVVAGWTPQGWKRP